MKNPNKYLGNEFKYVKKVLNSENWSGTSGSWNQALEKSFAKKIGARYAIAMNSGTSTLHAALEAAGIGYGDEVLSPAISVLMDTTATILANAVPVYVDVDPDTFNMDPNDLQQKITSKSKAIIVVGIYGLPPDLDKIIEIANYNDLIVIEDNAQCLLSSYKGKNTGTVGHMASYSFENTKHMSCGEGGMIVTNNKIFAKAVRKIGGHGFRNLTADEGRVRLRQEEFQNPEYKRHDILGWNYRMPEITAAVALAQLERIDELIELRKDSAKIFIDVLKSSDFLIPQYVPKGLTHSYYTLGVRYLGFKKYGVSWSEFRKMYVEAGGDGIYGAWSVPYLEPLIKEKIYVKRLPKLYSDICYDEGLCPIAEKIQPQLMQFKTNYRRVELAKIKASILAKIIKNIENR